MHIRLLHQEDLRHWAALRLEALRNAPASFGSSFEEEDQWSLLEFEKRLLKNKIFGAFLNDQLVGSAGLYKLDHIKTKHKGILWGMYIKPEYRRRGIADALLVEVINGARDLVIQLQLTCATNNPVAIRLYQKHGFKIYGTEPSSLKIDDIFYDEALMVLKL